MGLFGCYLVFDDFVGFYVLFMFLICEDLAWVVSMLITLDLCLVGG